MAVWGEEAVLFNPQSGDTHLVDSIPIALLGRCFSSVEFGVAELVECLDGDADELQKQLFVKSVLEQLIQKKLVEALSP